MKGALACLGLFVACDLVAELPDERAAPTGQGNSAGASSGAGAGGDGSASGGEGASNASGGEGAGDASAGEGGAAIHTDEVWLELPGDPPSSRPVTLVTVPNSPDEQNEVDLFWVDESVGVEHVGYRALGFGDVSTLGGGAESPVSAVSRRQHEVELFVASADGLLTRKLHFGQLPTSETDWARIASTSASQLTVVAVEPDRTDVFGLDGDGTVRRLGRYDLWDSDWSYLLGVTASGHVAAAAWASGETRLFVRANNGDLYTLPLLKGARTKPEDTWQLPAPCLAAMPTCPCRDLRETPSVVASDAGRADVFFRHADDVLWQLTYEGESPTCRSLGVTADVAPVALQKRDGSVELYRLDRGHWSVSLWSPGADAWSAFRPAFRERLTQITLAGEWPGVTYVAGRTETGSIRFSVIEVRP